MKLQDRDAFLNRFLTQNEWLYQQLTTSEGLAFSKQIASFELGFDRVDRLSRMPIGRQTIIDLIRGPDGYKMIEYMTTSSGGKEMGKMLSQASTGQDFNKPTGKVYTPTLLIKALEELFPQ